MEVSAKSGHSVNLVRSLHVHSNNVCSYRIHVMWWCTLKYVVFFQAFTTLIRCIKKRFEGEHVSHDHDAYFDITLFKVYCYLNQ